MQLNARVVLESDLLTALSKCLPLRRQNIRVQPEQIAWVVSILKFDKTTVIATIVAVRICLRLKVARIGVEAVCEFFNRRPIAANVVNVRFAIDSVVP